MVDRCKNASLSFMMAVVVSIYATIKSLLGPQIQTNYRDLERLCTVIAVIKGCCE